MSVYVTEELKGDRIPFELIGHRRTETARDEADAVGAPAAEVAKTVALTDHHGFVRAVLPASERLDLHKVRDLLGRRGLRLASEAELILAFPMFELGAVPPFGGPFGDAVVVDVRIAATPEVVLEAGTHTESLRVRTADLLDHLAAYVGDICRDRD
jgi:Ala-tRNA(Pro) deacylase